MAVKEAEGTAIDYAGMTSEDRSKLMESLTSKEKSVAMVAVTSIRLLTGSYR